MAVQRGARAVLATFILLIAFVLLLWQMSSSPGQTEYGISLIETPPQFLNDTPTDAIGVGFDLCASYGTVALSFPNGTVVAVAKVEAEDSYHEMMARLSLESSRHTAPPFWAALGSWGDFWRHSLREARKRIGLPASSDVAALVGLISALRAEAEAMLGHSINSALVATPRPVALYIDDIDDALDFAGLRSNYYVPYPNGGEMLDENIAAFVGYELDDPPHDPDARDLNLTTVLYTKTVLSWSMSVMVSSNVHHQYGSMSLVEGDFSLGAAARHGYPGDYWADVREHLTRPLRGYWRRPDVLLVGGESAGDPVFLKTLKDVMAEMSAIDTLYCKSDSLFAAAKGAAMLSRRAALGETPGHYYGTRRNTELR